MIPSEQLNKRNRLIDESKNRKILFTLKFWPVIALATIGLCFLTQQVAGWLGITLPDQQNLTVVKAHAGWNWRFAFICQQVVVLLPTLEELVFRGLLFRLLERFVWHCWKVWAVVSAVLFSAAHYIQQPFPDAAFVALAFFGFAQCWLYRKTDRIWCPMLNHALFNLTNLVLLFIVPEQGAVS